MPRPTGRTVVLLVAAAFAGAFGYLLLTRDRIPELTAARLEEARGRWRGAVPGSYTLRLEMQGSELARGTFEVNVQPGQVPTVRRDGMAITGDPGIYTVDGLHRVLEQELQLAGEPQRAFGAPPGYRAYLYARFDARGVPVRYRRVVGGANRWSEWTVLSLAPR